MSLSAVHHVQLSCPAGSEDRLRAFYAGPMGMTEVAKPPVLAARGGVWFRAGAVELHLGVEADFRPAPKAHPGLLCADLDAMTADLSAAGVDIEWDDNFPGYRRCYVHDPVGNRLELLTALDHQVTKAVHVAAVPEALYRLLCALAGVGIFEAVAV